MEKNLFVVPTNHIHQFWHLAEPLLQKAIDVSSGEFTIDQLKQFVAQGQSDLLLVMDEEHKCHCAFTVQWINYPLSLVTHQQNHQKPDCFGKGFTFVKNKKNNPYKSARRVNGHLTYLGYFGTPCGAYMAYMTSYLNGA
jgi:hypothetical protein